MQAKGAIAEAQRIANQLAAKQRAVAAVLSALEEAEIQRMPVATLRAIKMGRPFQVKPTGITGKGFAGFRFNESIKIFVGRQLLDKGFPKKIIRDFLDGFDKSVAECEGGFFDGITLCLKRDGELLQFNGLHSLPQNREDLCILMSGCERLHTLGLRLIVDELVERRMAFLERREYQEPDSVREERESIANLPSVAKLLGDHNPRFYMSLLRKIFGRKVTFEEFQWLYIEDGIYHFMHKASGRYLGVDHSGNYYRYEGGKYVPAEFDPEEFERAITNREK